MYNCILALLFVATISQVPADSKDGKELTRLETVWNEAHVKGDSETLDKMWDKELVVTVPKMMPLTKSQSLEVWKSGKFKIESYKSSDVNIKVHGDTAVVTGRIARTRTIGDRKLDDNWLFTKVYVRDKDTWKVLAFHASDVPEKK
jgi:hypothetical protein